MQIVPYFAWKKIGFDISCKLSPKEMRQIAWNIKSHFWENKKKYFKMSFAEDFTQHTKY